MRHGWRWLLVPALLLAAGVAGAETRGVEVKLKASESPGAPVAETVRLYGASHALVIGIDKYTNGWPRLSKAVEDARAVADELRRQGFDVTLKTDLTSDQFQKALKDFFAIKGADPDARLLLWFAGHGHTIGGEGFLVPADAPPATTPHFKVAALPMRDFGSLVRLAESKHVLSVFDSCFSGTIFNARAGTASPAITRKTTRPVRQFITAGDAGQQVRDDGSFREYFLRAIRGDEKADFNGDGYVTGEELGLFLNQQVAALTGAAQTPKSGKLHDIKYNEGDFVFPLPRAVQSDAQPSSPAQQAMTPEMMFWQSIQNSADAADYEAYLTQFPQGAFSALAKSRLQRLKAKVEPTATPAGSRVPEKAVRPTVEEKKQVAMVRTPVAKRSGPPPLHSRNISPKEIYVEVCAGCHGILRKGATGKNLEPANTAKLGEQRVEKIITLGTEGGMPSFDDILSQSQIKAMASYVLGPVDAAMEWGMSAIKESWSLPEPPSDRPSRKMNSVDLDNIFAVTLRDTGEIALIEGDRKRIWTLIRIGPSVHLSRVSASGRYLYVTSRNGKVDLVDLWAETPKVVASVKAGIDCRTVEVSKFKGYEDRYAIGGCYWPPQYVVMDGETLEPLTVRSTRGETVDGQYHPEPRVAGISSSRLKPEWVVNVKESGYIKLVDYADPRNVSEKSVAAAKFLHNGGWDSTLRYFLVAANASNKIAVLDGKQGQLAALINTKAKPHPGRGANFVHPKYGPVWATSHLGADVITLIGTDPQRHGENAWKVVEELKNHGSGALFVKTHPKSNNLWSDAPLMPEHEMAESVTVYDIRNLDRGPQVINISKMAELGQTKAVQRALHAEYNERGDEVWFSVWAGKTDPSAIVVLDDKTRAKKAVIKDPRLVTPTAKFNLYNTRNDIY